MMRQYISGEQVVAFYSNGGKSIHRLSNFALIEDGIEYGGLKYCSTEHAFQAIRFVESQRVRFSMEGDLGNIQKVDEMFEKMYGKTWEQKKRFWMKKGNIGIIAKMATSDKMIKKLGLKKAEHFGSSDEFWIECLMKKYEKEDLKQILLSTGNKYLLEFDRGSKRKRSYWAGLIEDNVLYGENKMGNYMMIVRDRIQNRNGL